MQSHASMFHADCWLLTQVRYWDLVIGVLLVFTATVTPFEVAYLNPHLDGTSSIAFANNVSATSCVYQDRLCVPGPRQVTLGPVFGSLCWKLLCMVTGLLMSVFHAVLFGINRCVDACFLADMFVQALLGFLDKKRNRWEGRPSVTIKTYCKHWLVVDLLSVVPYDAIVILAPSNLKLKVMLSLQSFNPFTEAFTEGSAK